MLTMALNSNTAPPFSLTRTLIVVALFLAVAVVGVMVIHLDHRAAVKKAQNESKLKGQRSNLIVIDELNDMIQFEKIEEYRHDFDDDRQAG